MDQKVRTRLLGKARQAATTQLVNRHREEFESLYVHEAAALGVEYQPRPSKEDRDREQIMKLLEENPGLREELLGQ